MKLLEAAGVICVAIQTACPPDTHARTHSLCLVCSRRFFSCEGWMVPRVSVYVGVGLSVFLTSTCAPLSLCYLFFRLCPPLARCVSLSLSSSRPPSLWVYLLVCLCLLPAASPSLTPCFSVWPSLPSWWFLCISGQSGTPWSSFLMGVCLGT